MGSSHTPLSNVGCGSNDQQGAQTNYLTKNGKSVDGELSLHPGGGGVLHKFQYGRSMPIFGV